MGSVSLGKVIALTQATVENNPNPMQVQSSYVFVDEVARDTYFAINFADLEKDKTYIYIENSSDLQVWSGDTNPASYIANWSSRIGFIKGDKGDSGSVGQGVNPAGLTGQVLKKSSNTNYDTEWDYIASGISNNDILIALGGELADSGKKFNDLGITINDIWSANQVLNEISNQVAKTLELKGNWDANTNTPDLDNISEGETYIVSVAGTNYGYDFEINDWIVKTDTGYAKINNNLATVVFSAIGGSPLDNPALALEFDKYINKIATVSTGNLPKITADGQIEDSGYAITDLFTKDLTEYTEKTVTLSNNDKMLVKDESTGLWKYSRIDKIPSANSSTLKVSDTDTIEGYLIDKIVGTTNYIILTKVNAGAEEQIKIEIGNNVFDKSTNTSDDIIEGTSNLLLTTAERALIGVLIDGGDGLLYLANDGTYKSVDFATWGNITGTLSNQTDLQSALDDKENTANKNVANGYVGLDANAKIDITYIPNSALERLVIVTDEIARFALTTTIAQNGDVVKQQDIDTMFYIVDDTNLNNASGYEEFAVGIAGAVEWSNILNKPIDIFHTETNTTDDIKEGTANLFDKEVVFTGGNNVTITGIYPNFEIQDNTMSQTDIQNALDTKLNSADNLTDVADQQTALNNITAVSGATNEHVLTKDTATGNAQWKEIVSSDELIKVSANDTTAGYLEDKIVGTTNKITVTPLDNSGYKDLQIGIGTDIFDKSIHTMDDIVDGGTYVKTTNNFTDELKSKLESISNPMLFKGSISLSSDFPLGADVQNGWVYIIAADVIDNDATKTNTGLSFLRDEEIAWEGSTWIKMGSTGYFTDDGTDLYSSNTRNINLKDGALKDTNVANAIKLGDVDNVAFTTTNKTIVGAVNEIANSYKFKSYGVISLPTITKEVDISVTIGADGVISFNTQADGLGNIESYSLAQQLIPLTDSVVNYIYADYNSGSPIYAVTTNSSIFTTNATYAPVVRATVEFGRIHFTEYDEYGTALSNKLLLKDIQINSFTRIEGLSISEKNTRELVIAAGRVNIGVENYHLLEFDSLTHDMYEYYKTAGIWQSSKVTALDSTYYCDGTNRQTLSNNKYVAKYIFRDVGDDLQAYFVHGNQKSSVEECRIEEVPALPTTLLAHAIYVGKIVYQKNSITGTVFTRTWGQTVQSVSPASHNDLGNLELAGAGVTYGHISDSTTTSVKDLAITDAVNGNLIDKSSLTNTLTNIESITTDLQRQKFYTLAKADVLIKTILGTTSTFVCKIEYHLYSMSFKALRTGIVKVLTDGITYTISDNADGEIGDTSDISFTANISGTDCNIYVTNAGTTSYIIKATFQDINY